MTQVPRIVTTRDLLRAWTTRTLRGRYQQSALGWLWAVIQPLTQVAIFSVVFTRLVPVDTAGVPYLLFSYAAVVPWTLLATSLSDMAASLVTNMNLVGKIYFPREALPLAAMFARLPDFGLSMVVMLVANVIYGLSVTHPLLLYLPVVLLIQMALMAGIGLAAAAMNVFYRDIDPLLKLTTQVWFYASPILYPVSAVPLEWRAWYLLNPMAGIVTAYRSVLLHQEHPGYELYWAAAISAVTLLAGYRLFRATESQFADVL